MSSILFELEIDGLSEPLKVSRFNGFEQLSSLYRFDILFVCEQRELDFSDIIGKSARLTIKRGDSVRHVHGIISDVEQGAEGKRAVGYRATVVPEAWRLQNRQDLRIFQEKAAPDIIQQLLDDAAFEVSEVKLQLQGSYAAREYCVQYRESDWAFISRLMEEEGIFFYFEHEEDKHTLIILDAPSGHGPISGDATVIFRDPSGVLASSEHVSFFRCREGIRPDKVAMRAHNFKKPDLDLNVEAEGPDDPTLEIYDYPGRYEVPADGTQIAKVGLERWQATRKQGWGESRCPRMTTGHLFTLADHPRADFNAEYLLSRIEHQGAQPLMGEAPDAEAVGYENRFLCIPSAVPFRPPQHTPKPTIQGVQTAVVVGPSGQEIHTDEHGRIKVQFHWDREGKGDENSSCWIRVAQPWAGVSWGAMFLPRVGHEVVVSFLEGDPDRPLIVGSVYHGTNVPPYGLPAEKTKSTLKSNSSTGGEGFNELRFDDKKDAEEIFLHGQKDWNIVIENDKTEQIGNDRKLDIGNDRLKKVGHDEGFEIENNQTGKIGGNKKIDVAKSHLEKIGKDQLISVDKNSELTVKGMRKEMVKKDRSMTVGGAEDLTIKKDQTVDIGGAKSESIKKALSETIGEGMTVDVGKAYKLSIGEGMTIEVAKDSKLKVDGEQLTTIEKKLVLQIGDAKVQIAKDGKITVTGKDISLKGEGKINVQGGKKIVLKSDGPVDVNASGKVKVKGGNVELN